MLAAVFTKALRVNACKVVISSRAMSSEYLVNDTKYSFLKELGLSTTNLGVFDGTWKGSGSVSLR